MSSYYKNRVYLFASEAHDDVRLDFAPKTIDTFVQMWHDGATYQQICKKLKIKGVEAALIAMHLHYADMISDRAGGFFKKEEK